MFKVTINDDTYKVSFHHVAKTDLANKKKYTVCNIQLIVGEADQKSVYFPISLGYSYCSKEDMFNYNEGRKLSMTRALGYFNNNKDRQLFWEEYFKVRGKY